MSPYELKEKNMKNEIKNIEKVAGWTLVKKNYSGTDSLKYAVEDNLTILVNPEKKDPLKYIYNKDGRFEALYRGNHPRDIHVYDKKGYLVNFGYGGEYKSAKRKRNTTEWSNVKYNRLEFIAQFNEDDQIEYLKYMGSRSGPRVEFEEEYYDWKGNSLLSKTMVVHYKEGGTDTSYFKNYYDEAGVLNGLESKLLYQSPYSSKFESKVEYPKENLIKLSFVKKDQVLFSMTFDEYDNWVEYFTPPIQMNRTINYRKKERKR
jgi:hypothetical protein